MKYKRVTRLITVPVILTASSCANMPTVKVRGAYGDYSYSAKSGIEIILAK